MVQVSLEQEFCREAIQLELSEVKVDQSMRPDNLRARVFLETKHEEAEQLSVFLRLIWDIAGILNDRKKNQRISYHRKGV